MRLTDEQRSAVNAAMAEAHAASRRPDGSVAVRAVPVHFLRILRGMEGIDPAFVGGYIDDLALRGASRVASDWRSSQAPVPAHTAKGTRVDAPRYAGTTRIAPDGTTEHVQLALEGMSLNDLRRHLAQAEKARNTSSRRIRLFTDLITVMETEGVSTVGDALAVLAGRAA